MNRVIVLVLTSMLLCAAPASAETGTSASGASGTAAQAPPATPDPVAGRLRTIRYGIESELLELFKSLAAEKESRYDAEILALLGSSTSPRLRLAALDLFRSLSWDGAEEEALRIVEGRDGENPQVVAAALGYLAEIRSKKALDFAKAIIDENDKTLLGPLVTLLGRAGSDKEEAILLAWLESDTPSPALRESSIKALGDIGSGKAGEKLVAILDNASAPRFERVFAAEAIAKIGWNKGLPSLVKAANGEDTTVQAAAVEALGSFEGAESDTALIEALRSSYAKSRIAACKAIAKRKLLLALPNLEYKVTSDPD